METFVLLRECWSQKCSVSVGPSVIEIAVQADRTTSCCKTKSCREGVSAATKLFACRCHLSHADSTTTEDLAHARMELRGARLGWKAQGIPCSVCDCPGSSSILFNNHPLYWPQGHLKPAQHGRICVLPHLLGSIL